MEMKKREGSGRKKREARLSRFHSFVLAGSGSVRMRRYERVSTHDEEDHASSSASSAAATNWANQAVELSSRMEEGEAGSAGRLSASPAPLASPAPSYAQSTNNNTDSSTSSSSGPTTLNLRVKTISGYGRERTVIFP